MANLFETINSRIRSATLEWLLPGQVTNMTLPNVTIDQDESKAQKLVLRAQAYYDGDQKIYLTDRQKAWLEMHEDAGLKFLVNHCATIIDTTVERLKVTGFAVSGFGSESEDEDRAKLLKVWWDKNRADAMQAEIYRDGTVSGDHFVLVDWDVDAEFPRWKQQDVWVSKLAGGSGEGMWIDYPRNDPFDEPIRAGKRWFEIFENERGQQRTIERLNWYYPDRIEKYWLRRNRFEAFEVEGEEWPMPWVMADGEPIGIPVAHFRTPRSKSDLKSAISLQDALNKAWLDLMAAADSTAFRMVITRGWMPTTDGKAPAADGSNLLKVAPGQWVGTLRDSQETATDMLDPASLDELLKLEERIVLRLAEVSKTPPSRFQVSRQVAAEGTLKEQEGPLLAKVEDRQTLFGNAWEDLMVQSSRQAVAFGPETDVLEREHISALWRDAQSRHEETQLENAEKKKALNVPVDQIWEELGYSEEEIASMRNSPEYKSYLAAIQMLTEDIDGG